MKKLIEIQSLIMTWENLIDLGLEYKTTFKYLDAETLEIETYCRHHRQVIEGMLEHASKMVIYTKDNTKLEIRVWE